MNKRLFTLLACALIGGLQAFSCAKSVEEEAPEEQRPQPSGNFASVEAYIVQPTKAGETKTDYDLDWDNNKALFRWVDDLDHIDVTVTDGTTLSSVAFTKMPDEGDNINFFRDGQIEGQATMADKTGYDLSDWAFYPSRVSPEAQDGDFKADWSYEGDAFKLDLPVSMRFPTQKPLAVVPMLGKRDADGKYAFDQMTGVLAIPVNNLPDDADFISITSESVALAGCFTLTDNGGVKYIAARAPANDAEKTLTLRFSGLEGDVVFYFPVPVGEIPAGLVVTAGNSADPDANMIKTTKKATTITRGDIVKTPALNFTPRDEQWAFFAAGQYMDEFMWSKHAAYESGTWVDVTVQRSGLHPEKYRINNPYTVANTQFDYTPYILPVKADDYLVFTLEDNDLVKFNSFCLGIEDKDSDGRRMQIVWSSTHGGAESRVNTKAQDGTPLAVQFGPIFRDPDDSSYKYAKDGTHSNQTERIFLNINQDLTTHWNKVADGEFIDEKLWSLHGWGSPRVSIELEQNEAVATRFRVANPYLIAKEQFSYTPYTSGITGADYLEFEIQTGDAVRFTTFAAGIEDKNSGGYPMKVWYPLDWGSSYTTEAGYNTVVSYRSDNLPAEIKLVPIYSDVNPSHYGYKYTDNKAQPIHLYFPEIIETWTDAGTVEFMDTFLWGKDSFPSQYVTVDVQKSSETSVNRYRIANPYLVAATQFGHTIPDGIVAGDDYLVFETDANGLVTFDSFNTGIDFDTSHSMTITHPTEWATYGGSSGSAADNKLIQYVISDNSPVKIQLKPIFHETGNYKEATTANGGYYYPPDGNRAIYINFPAPAENWSSIGNGRFKDKLVWSCANLTDYATVEFQQSSISGRFRIAKPYPGDNSGDWFVFDVTDPDKVTSDDYFVDYEVTASGKATFKPWVRNGHDYGYNYSDVVDWQSSGLPAVVEIGPCYRGQEFNTQGYSYEIGRDHESFAIEIVFPGCEPYSNKAIVTAYENPLKTEFHNPVASLNLPKGTLEKLVVKISGVGMSQVTGLRLYQSGWMDSAYVAPDNDGVVTMTSFNNPTVSGGIDLNFWLTGNVVGTSFRFDVQEVVVDGVSLTIVQDETIPHLGGVILNDGNYNGDTGEIYDTGYNTEYIRGENKLIANFRIPALVTSNAGTLIAAYDIRYDSSRDLVADIDVGVKRSTDGGKTWSPIIVAMDMGITGYEEAVAAGTMTEKQAHQNNGIGDPCLLVDENTGRIFCFAAWAHGHLGDADNRSLAYAGKGFEIADTPQFMMVYSDDDGKTWSDPINITRQIKKYDWRMTFQGPGRGITMKDGTLVIPMQRQEGEEKNMHSLYPLNSGIAYSTDHGETWRTHNFAYPITSECAVAEIEPGKLLLTMRDETDSHYRREYVTTDMGRTWTPYEHNGQMWDSTTEASILKVDASDNSLGQELLIFSSPQGRTGWRNHMTIQVSLDKGLTWPYSLLVDAGASLGYSCLTMVDPSTVGILYESSRGDIYFQAIPLTDIVK